METTLWIGWVISQRCYIFTDRKTLIDQTTLTTQASCESCNRMFCSVIQREWEVKRHLLQFIFCISGLRITDVRWIFDAWTNEYQIAIEVLATNWQNVSEEWIRDELNPEVRHRYYTPEGIIHTCKIRTLWGGMYEPRFETTILEGSIWTRSFRSPFPEGNLP